MKIKVGVSNRHVHLDEDTFLKLGFTKINEVKVLSQEGEFVSDLVIDLVSEKGVIPNVRVVGPLRSKTQVEISRTDSFKLGIKAPVKMSGNFDGASDIILVNKDNRVLVKNACILANRHVHCKSSELVKYGWYDGKVLSVKVGGIRGGILENVIVKSKDSYNLELHLDTDEANAFLLNNGDEVEILEEENGNKRDY